MEKNGRRAFLLDAISIQMDVVEEDVPYVPLRHRMRKRSPMSEMRQAKVGARKESQKEYEEKFRKEQEEVGTLLETHLGMVREKGGAAFARSSSAPYLLNKIKDKFALEQ